MKEYRLTPSEDDIVKCDDIECAEITVPQLLMRKPMPDAFFAVNDLTAAQTLMISETTRVQGPGRYCHRRFYKQPDRHSD